MSQPNEDKEIEILYDSECPMCANFSAHFSKEANITFHDARQNSDLLIESEQAKLSIDKGSIARYQGKLYHGPEALQLVARTSHSKDLKSRCFRMLFGSTTRAKLFYPLFTLCRRVLLWLKGKELIQAKEADK